MEILCSFRLVLERKAGKEIPQWSRLEFLEKFSENNFALSNAEDNNPGPLNRGGIADLPLMRTLLAPCQKSWEPNFWKVIDSFVLLAYASVAASRTLLQRTLSELYIRIRRFIFLVQTKKWTLWTMTAAQAAENHGDEWDSIWYFRWEIYTSIPTRNLS